METLIVELKNKKAYKELYDLEFKKLIRIISGDELNESLALPGKPADLDLFRKWIENADNSPSVSLTDSKKQWQVQRKKLEELIR
jgi:hypothetical protein